ncbi:hypothetical protein Dda_3870 [Drechslerella dactyloides]|uniref:Uncharacterized protein n=1 Tax=Drechslerella dactyloides TaxID=74499 RepID=A0AAD6NK61_DREDA|nr:hypothetical protein Dda_3870 [Drechslerella dactyloides]
MATYSRDLPPIAAHAFGGPAPIGLSTSLPTSLHQTNTHPHAHLHAHAHQHSIGGTNGTTTSATVTAGLDSNTTARCRTLQDLHDSTTSATLRNMYSTIIHDYTTGRIIWQSGSGYLYSTAGVLLAGPLAGRELKDKIVQLFSAGVYDVYTELVSPTLPVIAYCSKLVHELHC